MPYIPRRNVVLAQIPTDQLAAHQAAADEFHKTLTEVAQAGESFMSASGRMSYVSEGKVLIEISPGGIDMNEYWLSVSRRLK